MTLIWSVSVLMMSFMNCRILSWFSIAARRKLGLWEKGEFGELFLQSSLLLELTMCTVLKQNRVECHWFSHWPREWTYYEKIAVCDVYRIYIFIYWLYISYSPGNFLHVSRYIGTNMAYGISIATKYIQWNLTKDPKLRILSRAVIFI